MPVLKSQAHHVAYAEYLVVENRRLFIYTYIVFDSFCFCFCFELLKVIAFYFNCIATDSQPFIKKSCLCTCVCVFHTFTNTNSRYVYVCIQKIVRVITSTYNYIHSYIYANISNRNQDALFIFCFNLLPFQRFFFKFQI